MRKDIEVLKAFDDRIKVIKDSKEFRPYDELSSINIEYEIDDEVAEEFPDLSDAGYILLIKRIFGSILIGDEDPSLTFSANIDTFAASGWKITTSRINRISNMIFPHEIEINLDKKEILVLFNVYS